MIFVRNILWVEVAGDLISEQPQLIMFQLWCSQGRAAQAVERWRGECECEEQIWWKFQLDNKSHEANWCWELQVWEGFKDKKFSIRD